MRRQANNVVTRRGPGLRRAASPIFIVGAGRSGTTLVRTLLSGHSRIAVTPETHFMKLALRHGVRERDAPAEFEAFWTAWTGSPRFASLGLTAERCHEILEAQGQHTFRGAFAATLEAYAERLGKPRVGEKTPGHYRHLRQLLAWFPDARVVFVRRDPRAVVASALKTPWVTHQLRARAFSQLLIRRLRAFHVASQARGWVRIYDAYLSALQDDPRVTVVQYEALIREPDSVLKALCGFLGEPWEPAMLDNRARSPRPSTDPGGAPDAWHTWTTAHEAKAAAPISDESIDRWRRELSYLDRAMIEGMCGECMPRFAYAFSLTSAGRQLGQMAARSLLVLEAAEARARSRETEEAAARP